MNRRNNKGNSSYFEIMNKIDKLLGTLIMKKEGTDCQY